MYAGVLFRGGGHPLIVLNERGSPVQTFSQRYSGRKHGLMRAVYPENPRATTVRAYTHLLDDGEHPGLAIVVAVRADTEVDLVRVGISLVGSGQLEDASARRSGSSC